MTPALQTIDLEDSGIARLTFNADV